jgi:hypothetical protein
MKVLVFRALATVATVAAVVLAGSASIRGF